MLKGLLNQVKPHTLKHLLQKNKLGSDLRETSERKLDLRILCEKCRQHCKLAVQLYQVLKGDR